MLTKYENNFLYFLKLYFIGNQNVCVKWTLQIQLQKLQGYVFSSIVIHILIDFERSGHVKQ